MEGEHGSDDPQPVEEFSLLSPWERREIFWTGRRLSEQEWDLSNQREYADFIREMLENMNLHPRQLERLRESLTLNLIQARLGITRATIRNWCVRMLLKLMHSEHLYYCCATDDPREERIRHITNLQELLAEAVGRALEHRGISPS